jgi:hypothetical protein
MGHNNESKLMEHDITKLKPIHQKMYQEFVSSEYTPNEVPDELYNVWLTLAGIPEKDWGKPETLGTIESASVVK